MIPSAAVVPSHAFAMPPGLSRITRCGWGPTGIRTTAAAAGSTRSATRDSDAQDDLVVSWNRRPSATAATALHNQTKSSNSVKTVDVLSLESIRSTLIRQEETIIFALIERAQFRRNDIVYEPGGFGDLGLPLGSTVVASDDKAPMSFLKYMLVGTVRVDAIRVA